MRLIKFVKSTRRNKKYDAILEDNGRITKVSFGDSRYEHFKDRTGVGAWKHLDHNDTKRRELFRKRHGAQGHYKVKYSPAWFSYYYLW